MVFALRARRTWPVGVVRAGCRRTDPTTVDRAGPRAAARTAGESSRTRRAGYRDRMTRLVGLLLSLVTGLAPSAAALEASTPGAHSRPTPVSERTVPTRAQWLAD